MQHPVTIASHLLVYIQTGEVTYGGKWSGVFDLDVLDLLQTALQSDKLLII